MTQPQDPQATPEVRRSLRVSRRAAGIMGGGIIVVLFGTGVAIMGTASSKLRPYRKLGARLMAVFGNGPALAAIGQTQLPGVSPLQQWEALRGQFEKAGNVERWLDAPEAELPQAVMNAAKADFKQGSIKPCAGWLLSKTEASLCASVALTVQS
ncbi:MAG: hypothetical protein SFV15_01385 [Polyangiaceae bacterium]|nr:hypothetical protein [Polyangiaceae bacterium]